MTAEEKLAAEVTADFENRQKERKITERGWQLNINFVYGNQYCGIDGAGEIVEDAKKYYWQHRKVYRYQAFQTVENTPGVKSSGGFGRGKRQTVRRACLVYSRGCVRRYGFGRRYIAGYYVVGNMRNGVLQGDMER